MLLLEQHRLVEGNKNNKKEPWVHLRYDEQKFGINYLRKLVSKIS